jgi:hypothetical protein
LPYIPRMLWRNSRGRPLNAPAAFIHPCRPIVAKQPPSGPGWAHETFSVDGLRAKKGPSQIHNEFTARPVSVDTCAAAVFSSQSWTAVVILHLHGAPCSPFFAHTFLDWPLSSASCGHPKGATAKCERGILFYREPGTVCAATELAWCRQFPSPRSPEHWR